MSKLNKALGSGIMAALILTGCGPREVNPVTRAAIFGCIEIAEYPNYTNTNRAVALEQAGCGRFSAREIDALLPEYQAEHQRIQAEWERTQAGLKERRDAEAARQERRRTEWESLSLSERLSACGGSFFPSEWCGGARQQAKEQERAERDSKWAARGERRENFLRKCVSEQLVRSSLHTATTAEQYCSREWNRAEEERGAEQRQAERQRSAGET